MPLGDQNLTGVTKEQAMTAPGMAYFGGSGPLGKYCGDCEFKGFSYQGNARISPKTGEEFYHTHRSNGCSKAYELTGKKKPGPDFSDKMHACKYFIERKRE